MEDEEEPIEEDLEQDAIGDEDETMEDEEEPVAEEDTVEEPPRYEDHGKELVHEESKLETMTSLWK